MTIWIKRFRQKMDESVITHLRFHPITLHSIYLADFWRRLLGKEVYKSKDASFIALILLINDVKNINTVSIVLLLTLPLWVIFSICHGTVWVSLYCIIRLLSCFSSPLFLLCLHCSSVALFQMNLFTSNFTR